MGFYEDVKQQALVSWTTHKILPSVVVAQFILESGWRPGGTLSALADAPNHNLFGIKASTDWTGRRVNMPTREVGPQGSYWVNADFRAYDSWSDSIRDHAAFFTNNEWRKNNYRHVINERDYKKACRALQNAGYATDPSYASKLIGIVESYKLFELDTQALNGGTSNSPKIDAITGDKKVGGRLTQAAQEDAKKLEVTLIGDSLGVGTHPHLNGRFASFNHDTRGSRQITHNDPALNGTKVLTDMKNAGALKKYVVVVLGTNRGVTKAEVDNFVSIAGSDRKILFVDTASEVGHRESVAQAYLDASKRHSNVYYVNWSAYAFAYIGAWYHADGAGGTHIHMTTEGYKQHADYIVQAVYESSAGNFEVRTAQQGGKRYYGVENIDYEYQGLYSPKGQSVIYNPEANERWGFRGGSDGRVRWIDGLLELPNETVGGMLMTAAEKYMLEHSQPAVQYTVPLYYMPDTVSIGDRGIFIDHEFNPPLYVEATVLEISTSDTDDASNTVTIGNVVQLFADPDDKLKELEAQVKQLREEVLDKYRKGQPIELSMHHTDGLILADDGLTRLSVVAKQGVFDVPSGYLQYRWERFSKDTSGDATFNRMLQETQQASVLTVYAKDVHDKESTFICRVYDEDGTFVGNVGATVKLAVRGKSVYESWLEAGNTGTEAEFVEQMRGRDGAMGFPGIDGINSYTHFAWADSPLGDGFSLTDTTGKAYMGTYTDHIQADSTDRTRYKWVKVKGDDGKPGASGQLGQNLLIHSKLNKEGVSVKEIAKLEMVEDIAQGTDMVFTFRCQLTSPTTQRMSLYIGTHRITSFSLNNTATQRKTWNHKFKWPNANNLHFYIYNESTTSTLGALDFEWCTLQRGTVSAQDWSPSPKDWDKELQAKTIDIDAVQKIVSEVVEKVKSLSTTLDVTTKHALITHAGEYVKTIEKLVGNSVDLERRMKLIEQVSEQVETYFKFDDKFTIGKSNSKSKVSIDNDVLQFLVGETVVAHMSGNTLNAPNIVTKTLYLENHKIEKVGNKTVFRYIGG